MARALGLCALAVAQLAVAWALPANASRWLQEAGRRLRIVNGCEEPIWIAHLANVGVGPGQQNSKIEPREFHDFPTPGALGAARYWPKMGCDETGDNCELGGSGGPGEHCNEIDSDYSHCAPPVDTKFEGTYGMPDVPCDPAQANTMTGCDFMDISLVDGWTLPFKLEIAGGPCIGSGSLEPVTHVDCSGLSLDRCPKDDNLGDGAVNMQAINPNTGKVAGCYGPCLKLIDPKWKNNLKEGLNRDHPAVAPYCCTTPPMTSETCNAGPIVGTKYVQSVHNFCPGVYAFAYDDGRGLLRCPSTTLYELTFFCPTGGPKQAETAADRDFEESVPMQPMATVAPAALAAAAVPGVPPAVVPAVPAVKPAGFATKSCAPNELVDCPGGGAQCMGNQCCPDNTLCPSAGDDVVNQCLKPKAHDCTGGEAVQQEVLPSATASEEALPVAAAAAQEDVGIAGLQQKAQPSAIAQEVLAGTGGVSVPHKALLLAAVVATAGMVSTIYRNSRRGPAGYAGMHRRELLMAHREADQVAYDPAEQGLAAEAC